MARKGPDDKQLTELLLQALEHEKGGVLVYKKALECAVNEDLVGEWREYLEQTREHVRILDTVCRALGVDADSQTPGRAIVRGLGASLVDAMDSARRAGNPTQAQLVACDCVVLAETKDHANWELLKQCAKQSAGTVRDALQAAVDAVEDQEDEHLYHTKGWCRELWLESLGFRAVLPPPEERKHVKTAIGAARAEQSRSKFR